MVLRLTYGISVFSLTLAICVFARTGTLILAANSVAYLIACGIGSALIRSGGGHPVPSTESDPQAMSLGKLLMLSASQAAGNLFTQAGALGLGLLGAAAPLWSVTVRATSGMQTIGDQLVAPKIDIEQSLSVGSEPGSRRRLMANRLGVRAALAWSVISAVGISIAVAWTLHVGGDGELSIGLICLVVGYSITSSGLTPVQRVLPIRGEVRARAAWDLFRLAAALVALASGRRDVFIAVLCAAGVISYVWHLLLISRLD
jgi:hypothetical protein